MSSAALVDVLILASIHDFPTDRVCVALEKAGASYLRLNSESLSSAKVRLDPQEPRLEIGLGDHTWVVDGGLKSVWWRQPTFLRNVPHEALTLDEQLSRSQWPAFLRGLMVFDDAQWINHPAMTYRAESKPWQLHIAAKLGFDIPKTIITNDPVAPIVETIGNCVAVKSIDTVLLREGNQQYFAYTQLLDWSDIATSDLCAAPVVIQEAISPKLDLRVTVLGEQAWAVAVTADGGAIDGDWRLKKKGELAYPTFDLPLDVEQRCIELVRSMGLVYGAIDLAVSGDRFIFIEINPTGEWGWLDNPERPLAKAIAAALQK
ncbi:RimK-like protein [Rhizobium johnstonii]|uniref:RimK-like protein n=1 Tax=Rhizobium johnstonii TaxID=3019933 RepID=UPI003F9E41D3